MNKVFRDTKAGCGGLCNQGRLPCDCKAGLQLNTEQMRSTGAIEGPFRRPRPMTLSAWQRIRRAWGEFMARHLVDPVVRD